MPNETGIVPFWKGYDRKSVLRFAQMAEDLGYHSIWLPEAWAYEQFQLLTEIAVHTKRIKLAAGAQAGAASATAAERRAQLAYLQQIVHEATIRAPYDGVIATQYVMPGAHVRQGMPVIRIIGRGAMRVRFAVPEAEAKALHTGAQVTVAWDSRALEGTIDRVAPEVESASSSIVMEAIVDAPPLNGEERSALAGRVVSVRAVDAR